MITPDNMAMQLGRTPQFLDEQLQGVNGHWEWESVSSRSLAQSQVVSHGHMNIQAKLNDIGRLYIYMYIFTHMCIHT